VKLLGTRALVPVAMVVPLAVAVAVVFVVLFDGVGEALSSSCLARWLLLGRADLTA